MACRRAGHGKIGVQGFTAQRAASTTPADSESGDAESMDPPDMPRLDALDEEFGEDADAEEEIERLRGELDALKNDVKELAEAQHQAAHTIAAMKAAEEDLRRDVPPPYWYSNPATLDLAIANQPQWAGVAPPPRRPATARSESRGLRKRQGAPPASPAAPQ